MRGGAGGGGGVGAGRIQGWGPLNITGPGFEVLGSTHRQSCKCHNLSPPEANFVSLVFIGLWRWVAFHAHYILPQAPQRTVLKNLA